MNSKKLVRILLGIVLIAFGIGIFSLGYNDKDKFKNYNSGGIINIESEDGLVNIGPSGIDINDGDERLSIGWSGINISDGNEHVSIGWNGINVTEGNETKFNFGNRRNFFSFKSPKLVSHSIDEEQFEDINDINNISISSSFVNIKVKSQDRDDIRIHYHGNLTSNVLPKLKVEKGSNNINIKLETPNGSRVTTQSNVVLEVFVPNSYKGNFNGSSSSGKIDMKGLVGKVFTISASSGKLDLEGVKGELINISTSSGKVELEDSIGKINISTSSGGVELDNKKNNNDIKVSTSSGSIEIELNEDANYSIKGSSASGMYTPDANMDIIENEKGQFKATIGTGENSIDISTSSGSVKFK